MRSRLGIRQGMASLASAGALIALVLGPPWLLTRHVGWPLPQELPSLSEIGDALGGSRIDDHTIVKALALVCWMAWAQIVASALIEITAWARGRSALRVPAGGLLQPVARRLVLSALLLVAGMRTSPDSARPVAGPSIELLVHTSPATADSVFAQPAYRQATPEPATRVGLVRPRDSLWRLAERHLGDGLRWRELWELNKHREFPDGRAFRDPDLINPGWLLYFPADALGLEVSTASPVLVPPAPPPSSPSTVNGECEPEIAAPVTSTTMPTATSTTTPPASSVESPPAATPDEANDDDDGLGLPVGLVTGSLFAAGLFATVHRLQRIRQRRRQPGREVAALTPDASAAEVILRRAGDGAPVDRLGLALRAVSGSMARRAHGDVPSIDVVSVSDAGIVEVLFDRALDGATPIFNVAASGRAWTLGAEVDPDELERSAAGQAMPTPALAQVGAMDDRQVLIDIEAASATAVVGDGGVPRRLLLAIAYGLATSTLAEDLSIVYVGDAPTGLACLDRVEVVAQLKDLLPRLEKQAQATADALSSAGWATTLDARVANPADAWTPTIVLLPDPTIDADELVRLAKPATGVALVALRTAAGDFPSVLSCTRDEVVIESLALRLKPAAPPEQLLDATSELIEQCVSDEPGPELVVPALETRPEPEGKQQTTRPAAKSLRLPIAGLEDETTEDVHVNVLGSVEVVGGLKPIDRRRSEELVVYLSLHPDGVDEGRLKAALWPNELPSTHTFNQTVSRARSCLGVGRDGGFHLPHVEASRYRLGPMVHSDYQAIATALSKARHDTSPEALDDLREALAVVRGIPFVGTKRGWEWIFSEGIAAHITSVVSEAAHVLASDALDQRDPKGALWAAAQGQKASPADEILYRDRMLAHDLEGNPAGVEATMDELMKVIEGDEPLDSVHPDTLELYERLSRRRRRTG